MGMENPVEAALRTDVQPTICQNGHDLTRWQRGEFRLVAGEQDSLALCIGKAVRHQAGTALTAIPSVPITRELAPPALQGGEPHAQ
jgi:hypothetical protein